MFVVELPAGRFAHSTALLAAATDMLGDAIVYGVSLVVIGRRPAWQIRPGLLGLRPGPSPRGLNAGRW